MALYSQTSLNQLVVPLSVYGSIESLEARPYRMGARTYCDYSHMGLCFGIIEELALHDAQAG